MNPAYSNMLRYTSISLIAFMAGYLHSEGLRVRFCCHLISTTIQDAWFVWMVLIFVILAFIFADFQKYMVRGEK